MADARRGYNPLDGAETPTDKPCKICTDFRTYAKMRSMHKFLEKKESQQQEKERGCPLDREELGRNTWSFIHTMAAYYPEKPNIKQQDDMKQFIHLFAKLFPCDDCSKDLQNRISQELPDTSSRYALSQWWCRRHNEINEKLGKPKFDCSLVDQRWRDGWKDGSCD